MKNFDTLFRGLWKGRAGDAVDRIWVAQAAGRPRRIAALVGATGAAAVAILLVLYLTGQLPWSPAAQNTGPAISHYTCPMHPQIRADRLGSCPICSMKLVPVYPKGPESHDGHSAKEGSAFSLSESTRDPVVNGVVISPERQQLIGLRTVTVTRKPAFMSIRTSGRVAFDPELAVAIREYLSVRYDGDLRSLAASRLRILGMGDEEIRRLPERGGMYENLYLPSPGGAVWIYANLYEQDMPFVRPEMLAEISVSHTSGRLLQGTVNSLSPVVDPKTRSIRARIYVPKSDVVFRPDSFVNVTIKADLGTVLVIPRAGLLDSGTKQIVFVVDEQNRFSARDVRVGPEAADDIVIVSGLKEGERVVGSAAFLVDAESNLKASVSGMEGHKH